MVNSVHATRQGSIIDTFISAGGFGARGAAGGRGGGRGAPGGRGRGGGGRGGRGGAKGGANVILEPHRHPGVFVAKGKEHLLVTRNLVPGESVYGEKRISIEGPADGEGAPTKTEYRVWNPFRSKLAAGILGGLDDIYIAPGKKVLYLGAASGTSVSHVADVVGPVSVFPLAWRGLFIIMRRSFRKVQSMRLNSHTVQAAT